MSLTLHSVDIKLFFSFVSFCWNTGYVLLDEIKDILSDSSLVENNGYKFGSSGVVKMFILFIWFIWCRKDVHFIHLFHLVEIKDFIRKDGNDYFILFECYTLWKKHYKICNFFWILDLNNVFVSYKLQGVISLFLLMFIH